VFTRKACGGNSYGNVLCGDFDHNGFNDLAYSYALYNGWLRICTSTTAHRDSH